MTFYVRQIHGAEEVHHHQINLASPSSKKVISIGSGPSVRIQLPKGEGIANQAGVIKMKKNTLVFQARQAGVLVRAAGEAVFDKVYNDDVVPLHHGQLIKIGQHLFDVIDSAQVKKGEDVSHSIRLANVAVKETVRPGVRDVSADWQPLVRGARASALVRIGRAILRPTLEIRAPFRP